MRSDDKRWLDIPALLLLLVAVWLPALRLSLTKWTPDLARLELLVILGVLVGSAVGYCRAKKWLVAILLLLASLVIVPWQMSRSLAFDIPITELVELWVLELLASLRLVLANQPVTSPVLFLTAMGFLYWTIGILSSYGLVRYGKLWVGLFLAGIAIFLVDFYHPYLKHPARYTGVFVLSALLLVARVFYLRSRRNWEERSVRVDYDTGYSITRSAVVAGFLVVLVTWNINTVVNFFTPQPESGISSFWENLETRLENIVLGLQNSGISTGDYGNNLSLGSGAALGENVVFRVYLNPLEVENIRLYWRGHTYDRYDSGQWRSTLTNTMTITPSQWPLAYPAWQGRKELTIEIAPQTRAQRTVFAPQLPLSMERQSEVVGSRMPDGTFDFVALVVNPSIGIGDEIEMKVWLSAPTVAELRAAGQTYPPYLVTTYLDIPEALQPSFIELAKQITAGLDNPYDRVVAITNYLRTNIEYELVVNPPPINRDPLEYFLFDSQVGFCNYYASAAVLMIRSLGIPARLAVGYAEGVYRGDAYEIRSKDSHAWPEVFFPGFGWVEFEPTAIQPATQFPQERRAEGDVFSREGLEAGDLPGVDPLADREFGEPPEGEGGIAEDAPPVFPWLAVITLGLLVSVVLLFVVLVNRDPGLRGKTFPQVIEHLLTARQVKNPAWLEQWSAFSRVSPVARRYHLVNAALPLACERPIPGMTPRERMEMLAFRIPKIGYQVRTLLEEFQRECFSSHPADDRRARTAFRSMVFPLLQAMARRITRI